MFVAVALVMAFSLCPRWAADEVIVASRVRRIVLNRHYVRRLSLRPMTDNSSASSSLSPQINGLFAKTRFSFVDWLKSRRRFAM